MKKKSADCPVCRLVRLYLLLAVPLIAVLGTLSVDSTENSMGPMWFARVELIDILAWGSLAALLLVLCYRLYADYWIPKQRQRSLERLLEIIRTTWINSGICE